jgi:hypothetical protein
VFELEQELVLELVLELVQELVHLHNMKTRARYICF